MYLKKNEKNYKFVITNTILAKSDKFSIDDLQKEIQIISKEISRTSIENCIDELIDFGLVYEEGKNYLVKQEKWNFL